MFWTKEISGKIFKRMNVLLHSREMDSSMDPAQENLSSGIANNKDAVSCFFGGELRLSGNYTVTEYEMIGKPCSQKSGLKNHTNERIFQVMTRFDQFMTW